MSDDENTFEVNITETSRAPAWGIALAAQINAQYRSISKQINSVKADCSSISEQLADFKTKVQMDIQRIDEKATEALNTANANKAAISANADTIKRLETELNRVNRKCDGLELENEKLTNQQESHESYSRGDNLLIRGIKEQHNETQETCIAAVRDVLIRDFKMEPDFVNKIVIVRCHRFGSSFAGGIDASFLRPMIVRFLNFNDRQAVWMKRFDLTNKSISISENFANNIEKRRRFLYPVVKKANSLQPWKRPHLARRNQARKSQHLAKRDQPWKRPFFFIINFFSPYAYFPSAVDLTLMSLSTLGRISTLVKPGTAHFQAGQGELSINLVRLCPILH